MTDSFEAPISEHGLQASAGSNTFTRRTFLQASGAFAATLLSSGLPEKTEATALPRPETARSAGLDPHKRRATAFELRHKAALYQRDLPLPLHLRNGDEERYPNFISSFSKSLPHNALGEVDPISYQELLNAADSAESADFNSIPLGGAVKLVNPQAAYAFSLEGADGHHIDLPSPPAFGSEAAAGEMAELYWQALARDVPFARYPTEALTNAAAADLRRFANFQAVTAATLFRTSTPGEDIGPYLSQFLWLDVPYGLGVITQKYRTPIAGVDFLTDYDEWLAVQNGATPMARATLEPTPRYLRTGRDLAEWVHRDFTYQGFLNAALILLSYGPSALSENNPYRTLHNQGGFVTFGAPFVLDLVTRVANEALKAAWCQKWLLHRRLRPEEFGGRIHFHHSGQTAYPIHEQIFASPALEGTQIRYGAYFLPMAYPEGCPAHPSYPAGHAAIAGACVTVLKAFFNEAFIVPQPKIATDDGLQLEDYLETDLTVAGELNKLAANIAVGRNLAGVHYFSDGLEGLKLGETVALRLLADHRRLCHEHFEGFTLTTFDGEKIVVG